MFSSKKNAIHHPINWSRVSQSNEAYLLHTPPELHKNKISPYLDIQEMSNLCLTSYTLYNIYNEEHLFKILQCAIMDDDIKTVKTILDKKPELLIKKLNKPQFIISQKTHQRFFAENPINALPFRLATLQRSLEMVKLILPYFDNLKEGKQEAIAQWAEPPQLNYDFLNLINIIASNEFDYIENSPILDQANQETVSALDDFRNRFILNGIIELDNYYDREQLLIKCSSFFRKYFNHFGYLQRELYCIYVLGFIQKVSPCSLVKDFCQGINNLSNKLTDRANSFLINNHDQTPFYCSDPNAKVGCGFDFYIGMSGKLIYGYGGYGDGRLQKLKAYYEKKNNDFSIIKENLGLSNLKATYY